MPLYSKESLDTLRQRVDLTEVLSAHMELKRSGASYKGLCPFHDEKTPSFMVQKGDTHYHCFGCGAHGDSIQFLMSHLKMNFQEAVESLAQRFNVTLQIAEFSEEKKGPNKAALKEALENACRFFHFLLLHSSEGHQALDYLYKRGIDLDFIHRFRIGLAPRESGMLRKVMHAKFIKDDIMGEAGLISPGNEGYWRDFFLDRITFPISDASGSVIGFSARKFKETTFGGKYINTPETPLFKKSHVLFGLNYSRRRIAKERKAIIVEGQIDALRLISSGFDITVAGQGTAFGEGHVKELLNLGIREVYLALDSDQAGQQAAYKIGDFFQREGVEARVISLPPGSDPDAFLCERGPQAFLEKMQSSIEYLDFSVNSLSKKLDMNSPAGKNELVQTLVKQIRSWNHPLMVHESLRKLANLVRVPEAMVGVGEEHVPNIYIKKSANIGLETIDPDKILESDFLHWILLQDRNQSRFLEFARLHLKPEELHVSTCRQVYQACIEAQSNGPTGLLDITCHLADAEGQNLISEILRRKVNRDRAEEHFIDSIQKILNRNWMEQCEEIKLRIQSAQCTDEEATELSKKYTELRRSQPHVPKEGLFIS